MFGISSLYMNWTIFVTIITLFWWLVVVRRTPGVILITLFNSTYHFTHLLIHSVWLQVWSDRKWIRYGCILLLYILCVLWVLFYTLHFLYLVLFLSLSDNSSSVANVICLLKPTWNKVYLILSYLNWQGFYNMVSDWLVVELWINKSVLEILII